MACVEYCKNNKINFLTYIYSILFVLFSFILFETATRGTILGLIAGILVACAFYAIFGRSKVSGEKEKGQSNKSRMIAGGVIVLFIIVGVLFYFNRNAKWIQNNQTLGRLASISLNDTKTQARGYIWPMAIKDTFSSVKTSVIGIGQENFNYIFNKEYNPKMWAHEQWFDRAHSVFLDWLVASGLLGLIIYLSLYIISIIYVWKSEMTIGQKSMFMALIVGYGIHNIFVFDNQTSYVMFFTILAFIHSISKSKTYSWLGHSAKEKSEDAIVVRDYIFVPLVVIAFIAGFYFINVRNIQANTRLISALRACSNEKTPSADLYAKALKLSQTTADQEIREQLISCASNVIGSKNAPLKMKTDFYTLTKTEIEKQISTTPNDARIYVIGGSFLNSIGDFTTALPILEKARELTPGKQSVAFDLATNYMNTGKAQEALDIVKKAYESAPDYPMAKSAYVVALINMGDEKKAHELFPNDPDLFTDQRVINIYFQKKQYDKVIEILKGIIAKNPDDLQNHLYLASVYMANKQSWLAIAELKIVKEKYPAAKDGIDQAIKEIEAGKNPLQ
jgi:tetratricopeptide (TPR) repeat protein